MGIEINIHSLGGIQSGNLINPLEVLIGIELICESEAYPSISEAK